MPRWLGNLLASPLRGYLEGQAPKAEPTAWAAVALASSGHVDAAKQACNWLVSKQRENGSVLAHDASPESGWPTAPAAIAWSMLDGFDEPLQKGIQWIESHFGAAVQSNGEFGHNTQLVAWPWIGKTHSWIEPTSFHLMALKAAGRRKSIRAAAAVELLRDRQLAAGGCNYGNTTVLGTTLRPHMQPTGIALAALCNEPGFSAEIARAKEVLETTAKSQGLRAGVSSLCWASIGLQAHRQHSETISELLRMLDSVSLSPAEQSVAALAQLPPNVLFYEKIGQA